jgi:glycosyltransferase involved in cell wall biosynthesis
VVLPTRNESRNIDAFLDSLPPEIPLVVVDASDDDTIARILARRRECTRIIHERCNVTHARQIGAECARSKWLLFTDADVIFAPDYFDRVGRYLNRPECDAVYGAKLSRTEFSLYYKNFARAQQLAHTLGMPAATGSNMLVSAEVFAKTGGFDLRLNCNEDSELMWRVRRSGYRVTFDPDLSVYAVDHRRLYRGRIRKTLHSFVRCALMYCNLMPSRWRSSDWGYWSGTTERHTHPNP